MSSAVEVGNAYGDRVLEYDYSRFLLPPEEDQRSPDMWRYRGLLPLGAGPIRYPLPVGGTPLRGPAGLRDALQAPALWLKDETTGPSASNKDRATALVLEAGLRAGASVVTTASTGNAAIATAVGGAAVGLEVAIFVPADCRPEKVAVMRGLGACVFRVTGGYGAAVGLSRAAAAAFGWLDRNTGVNPLTVEGKKTVSFEIWEQLGRRVPEVAVAPVGDGTTLVGLAKGFRELVACGVTSRMPRLIAVQAEQCQPLARAWRGEPPTADSGSTVADGIAVPVPALPEWTLEEVRRSGGTFVVVSDSEMTSAMGLLADRAGVPSEPAGAAALAGYRQALIRQETNPDETAVVLVTGRDLVRSPGRALPGPEFTVIGELVEVERHWATRPTGAGRAG